MEVRVCQASAVIVQRVPAVAVSWFLEWQRGVTAAAERFAGYRGTDVYPPADGRDDASVVVLHFENEKSLEVWLGSPTRAEWLQKLRTRIGDFELQKLPGGLGPWFARLHGDTSAPTPAGWRMVLTVLLGLYPTVVLLSLFPGKCLAPLGMAVSLLIGNALSVSLLQWGVMPLLVALFAPWLRARADKQPALVAGGVALIVFSLAALTVLFRQVIG